ncbi:MAG: diguanylate cyclase domain-containing protein [Anaerolineae bacterium]
MTQLRFWIAALIVWLIFFFNIERLDIIDLGHVDIKRVTYSFVAIVAISTLLIVQLQRIPLTILVLLPVPLFLLVKTWYGAPITGSALPLTITELSGIILTSMLTRQINHHLKRIDEAVEAITLMNWGELMPNLTESQGVMYRELRRARRHQRPLSLICLKVDEGNVDTALSRALEEIEARMTKRYLTANVARALNKTLHDYDIIAQQDESLIVLLPEVDQTDLSSVLQKVKMAVSKDTKTTLKIGVATYPDEAMTFESLVKRAQMSMEAQQEITTRAILEPSQTTQTPQ